MGLHIEQGKAFFKTIIDIIGIGVASTLQKTQVLWEVFQYSESKFLLEFIY